jgi:acetyltransferase-like isoleucine patch superfamily enzyme
VTHPYEDILNPTKIGARILNEDSFVEIGDGTFLGFGTIVLPNVRVGKYAVTAAHSVIVKDVPDYSVVAGTPAQIVKQFDHVSGQWQRILN